MIFYKVSNLKQNIYIFFWRGGGAAGVSDFFTQNLNISFKGGGLQ